MHKIPLNLKLVILDCDGVLFDSFRSNVVFYNSILEKMGEATMGPEEEKLCHVYSTPQLFEHIFFQDPGRFRLAMKIAGEIDYLPFLEYMDPEPGLYEMLEALATRYRLAMATNRGKSTTPLLKRFGIDRTFEAVSTIQVVENPNPHRTFCSTASGRQGWQRPIRSTWETWKMIGSRPRRRASPSS
jgi:phosphoglycolate phosphatase